MGLHVYVTAHFSSSAYVVVLLSHALRYHGQLVPASAVDPERGGAPFDGHQATRPHFTSSIALALAASEATGRLQIEIGHYCLPVAARRNAIVPRGRLPAYR